MPYNNKQYWNNLVGQNMSLREVGWPQWTEAFNAARYKLTAEQTIETLQKLYTTPPKNILEIGCGIGFWTNIVTQLYPDAKYVGIDISQKAVENLQIKFASNTNAKIICADVGLENFITDSDSYDLVLCMEVLLHITDDTAWQYAIKNILKCTNQYAIISDPFIMWQGKKYSADDNNKTRKWSDYQQAIEKSKGEIIAINPRTFLLDNNIDFKTKIGLQIWNLFFKIWNKLLCIQNEKIGNLLGKMAYGFDKWYCGKTKFGHSCRQIVIRKK
jgi:2-polyprenyl-3-methyl-5-hydroxy-6-metoxy-1,4-benzoquinol methylase